MILLNITHNAMLLMSICIQQCLKVSINIRYVYVGGYLCGLLCTLLDLYFFMCMHWEGDAFNLILLCIMTIKGIHPHLKNIVWIEPPSRVMKSYLSFLSYLSFHFLQLVFSYSRIQTLLSPFTVLLPSFGFPVRELQHSIVQGISFLLLQQRTVCYYQTLKRIQSNYQYSTCVFIYKGYAGLRADLWHCCYYTGG